MAAEVLEADRVVEANGEPARLTAPRFQLHSSSKQDHLPRSSQRPSGLLYVWYGLSSSHSQRHSACLPTSPQPLQALALPNPSRYPDNSHNSHKSFPICSSICMHQVASAVVCLVKSASKWPVISRKHHLLNTHM